MKQAKVTEEENRILYENFYINLFIQLHLFDTYVIQVLFYLLGITEWTK